MTHTEANILAENGFTVDASLKYATARFGAFYYVINLTEKSGGNWQIRRNATKLFRRPAYWTFRTFGELMEFLWSLHREKAFSAIV